MQNIVPEIISIADACLGGLRGRSALLIGPEERQSPYAALLRRAGMKSLYQENTPLHIAMIIPHIQLLMSMPRDVSSLPGVPLLTAANIALGCTGRRTPLLIFDLARPSSVEELAGLLPTVCLYTPDDLQHIVARMLSKRLSGRQILDSFDIIRGNADQFC